MTWMMIGVRCAWAVLAGGGLAPAVGVEPAGPTHVAAAPRDVTSGAEQQQDIEERARLMERLVEQGFPAEEAEALVASLTDEDVGVLAENPGMLAVGGQDEGDEGNDQEKWALILGIGGIAGIAAGVILAVALSI